MEGNKKLYGRLKAILSVPIEKRGGRSATIYTEIKAYNIRQKAWIPQSTLTKLKCVVMQQ